MSDPHANDYCVVCNTTPSTDGPRMYPVVGIENGCVCGDCIHDENDGEDSQGISTVVTQPGK